MQLPVKFKHFGLNYGKQNVFAKKSSIKFFGIDHIAKFEVIVARFVSRPPLFLPPSLPNYLHSDADHVEEERRIRGTTYMHVKLWINNFLIVNQHYAFLIFNLTNHSKKNKNKKFVTYRECLE